MEKNVSNKLIHYNFILCVMIVFLHANCLRFLADSNIFVAFFYKYISIFTDAAVPLFFIISGYLFFRNFKIESYPLKIKSRIKSLVVPYLFWSIIFLIYYSVITIIPGLNNYFDNQFNLSLTKIPYNIIMGTCAEGIWYIRVLVVYVIFSPIIYIMMKQNKKMSLIIIILSSLFKLIFNVSYSNPLFWLPVYLLGAYLAIFHNVFLDTTEFVIKNKKIYYALIFFVAFQFICIDIDKNGNLYYLYRLISPLFIFLILESIKLYRYKPFKIEKISFLLYCTHLPLLKIIRKILFILFGYNQYVSIFIFVVSIILTIGIIYYVYIIIDKIYPKFLKIITGDR